MFNENFLSKLNKDSLLNIFHFNLNKQSKFVVIASKTQYASFFCFGIYEHKNNGKVGKDCKGPILVRDTILPKGRQNGSAPFFFL